MTPKFSLIIGVAVSALAFGVPTALGEGRLAGSPEITVVAPDWFERAAMRAQDNSVVVSRPDSHDVVQPQGTVYVDAAERALRIENHVVPTAQSDVFDRSEPPAGSRTSSTEAVGSGSELDWPQIGIGFGIGLALALGLYLAMRFTRIRPLAH